MPDRSRNLLDCSCRSAQARCAWVARPSERQGARPWWGVATRATSLSLRRPCHPMNSVGRTKASVGPAGNAPSRVCPCRSAQTRRMNSEGRTKASVGPKGRTERSNKLDGASRPSPLRGHNRATPERVRHCWSDQTRRMNSAGRTKASVGPKGRTERSNQ